MEQKFRADIQGLRGISVLLVVLFHLSTPLVPGGFVGVDIFFVISGYLITSQIVNETKNGKFKLRSFYLKRIKRLAPGFLSVAFFTIFLSLWVLPPEHLVDASKGLISSLLFVSNFYFIFSSDYFDIGSEFRPFIHTWSLSVEEQFYLFWPIICLVFMQKLKIKSSNMAIVAIGIIVLSVSTAILLEESRASFYFTPARIYELLLGATLSILGPFKTNKLKNNIFSMLGIFFLCISVLYITPQTPFPSYYALFPCIGACILIMNEKTFFNKVILENRFLGFFGNISYSLYLIHWPVITLSKFLYAGPRNFEFNAFLFVVSLILALINYKFIEQKFRNKKITEFQGALKIIAIIFMTLIIFSIILIQQHGWNWRYSSKQIEVLQKVENSKLNSQSHFNFFKTKSLIDANGNKNILIVGDSHSVDFFNALSQQDLIIDNYNLFHFSLDETCFAPVGHKRKFSEKLLMIDHSIISKTCEAKLNEFRSEWESVSFDKVLLGNAIRYKTKTDIEHKRIPNLLKFYSQVFAGSEIIFLGLNNLSFEPKLAYLMFDEQEQLNNFFFSSGYKRLSEENERLRVLVESSDVKYLDVLNVTCSEKSKSCYIFNSKSDVLFYEDDNHWSYEGEKLYGDLLGKKIMPKLYIN